MWCCTNATGVEVDADKGQGYDGYEDPEEGESGDPRRRENLTLTAPQRWGSPPDEGLKEQEEPGSKWSMLSGKTKAPKRTFNNIAEGLLRLYMEKLLNLERESQFTFFHQPEIPPAYFSSRPMVLLMGAYSTGKTTFVQHLMGHQYPNAQIGPEPTTDRFVAVCHGPEAQIIPGNALVYDKSLPFTPLRAFGNSFLSRLECARIPNAVLEGVTFIDTPGVLSGEKQRLKRGYDFEEVMQWFADHSAMIILFFDAHKPDVSDELMRCTAVLAPYINKVHVVLNKADQITTQQLLRVNGALMWSLGKVLDTPEVTRVYVGSFWDEPLQNEELRSLFELEMDDLYRHIEQLPRSSSVQKINDLSKRARLVKSHALLLEHIRSQMPTMWGHAERQQELINNLPGIVRQLSRSNQISTGDFPKLEVMREKLSQMNCSQIRPLDFQKIRLLDNLLSVGIPELLAMVPAERWHGPS
jgi:EH domain-containing protein 1